MRFLIKLLKGALIGISVVIPGVSGGSMAMSMGIYDKLLDFLTLRKQVSKQGRILAPYILGMVFGVIIFSYFIERLFIEFPLITACAFAEMILGALPRLIQRVRGKRISLLNSVLLIGMAAGLVLLTLNVHSSGTGFNLNPTLAHAMLAVVLGFLAAAVMAVPGLSGSMLLILLGYYQVMLQTINRFTEAILALDFATILKSAVILVPFAIGVAAGFIFMARIIRILIKRLPYSTYYIILGLITASPLAVIYPQNLSSAGLFEWILGLIAATAGFFLAKQLGKEGA